MLDFNKYVARHGEYGVQAIIEGWERFKGISSVSNGSLEDRWNYLVNDRPLPQFMAA